MYSQRDNRKVRTPSPMVMSLIFKVVSDILGSEQPLPVTIAFLFLNIYPHIFDVNVLGYSLWNTTAICIQPRKIFHLFQAEKYDLVLLRLIAPAFVHGDDIHLYYNMISLLWKGSNLEKRLGSESTAILIVFSLIVSHVLMVLLGFMLAWQGVSNSISGYESCAVGFSAVLFSLKYVWNSMNPSIQYVQGIPVPSKYLAWVELFITSMIVPNVSHMGHFCGILAGMIYVHILPTILRSFGTRRNTYFHSNARDRRWT